MKNDSLVSINLVYNNTLMNPTDVPILFYWNGGDGVLENSDDELKITLENDADLKTSIKEKITSKDIYENGKLAYFYFKLDNDEEKYTEGIIPFSDILYLMDFDNMWVEYTLPMFAYLYKCATKNEYVFSTNNHIDEIISIYELLCDKYKNKITIATVVNYVYSELKKNKILSDKNQAYVIHMLKTLLENK